MGQIELRVPMESTAPDQPDSVVIRVDEDASFVRSVFAEFGFTVEQVGQDTLYLLHGGEIGHQLPGRYENYVEVEASTTVAEVLRFVGDEPFVISFGGWGGDALWSDPLVTISELIQNGLTLHGVWALAAAGAHTVKEVRWRRERQMAERWRDSDDQTDIPLALTQAVRKRRAWYRGHFDYVFGLEGESGTRLLKAHGYRRVENGRRDVVWVEEDSPDSIAWDHEYLAR